MESLTPTKANLIKSKSMLTFTKQGYLLLDKKRNVLIREMMAMIDEVEQLQKQIDQIFSEVYDALEHALVTLGESTVTEIALSIPKDEQLTLLSTSVMNVEIPKIQFVDKPLSPYYGFYRTNSAIDLIVVKMAEAKKRVYHLAEVENTVFRLALEIKRTSKRANALDKIQIPKYEHPTKWIAESPEEKEREDFFRLKRLK